MTLVVLGKTMTAYRVYVSHNYGVDKLLVTMPWAGRSVEKAGRDAAARALRTGHTCVVVLDVIPMRWVNGEWVQMRGRRGVRAEVGASLLPVRRPKVGVMVTRRVHRRHPVERG